MAASSTTRERKEKKQYEGIKITKKREAHALIYNFCYKFAHHFSRGSDKMRLFKKLDIFIFKSYSLLFIGTFFICLFIFMMQFMWLHIDKLIGKGLSIDVLAQFFFYASLTLMPMSLPLAILLASLITFGNFGERFELLSMKAAGISLIRIFQPTAIFALLLSAGSFYFQNVTSPNASKKLAALLYSMKQKSPELEIPEGIFYNEIPGYNLFVEKKNKETGMLYGVMIYNNTNSYEDTQIVLADSALLQSTADKMHLRLTLYQGERFQNMKGQNSALSTTNIPYMRETFIQETDLIAFDANFNALDASSLSRNAQTKNILQIRQGIDSITALKDSTGRAAYKEAQLTFMNKANSVNKQDSTKITAATPQPFDSMVVKLSPEMKQQVFQKAAYKGANATSDYEFRQYNTDDLNKALRLHWVEFNKKITLSLACLIFFFIGAPLGAIIRKGGLGVPVVVSVAIFIFYYIINVSGEKMAKSGEWNVTFGMWMSSMILIPIGAFLTYKANNDSVVFNIEAYQNFFKKLLGLRVNRHISCKEVIIDDPDYPQVAKQIEELTARCRDYALRNKLKRAPNYFRLFFSYQTDHEMIDVCNRLEELVTILSNSRDAAILEYLNRLPVLSPHAHTRPFERKRLNQLLGIILPAGLFFYFRIWFYRLRLYKDLTNIQTYGARINQRIETIITTK